MINGRSLSNNVVKVVGFIRYTYHYTKLTFVCESGRSREAVRPELKTFLFLHRWTWTCSSSLTQLAMALAATKVSRFKRAAGQN